MTEWFMCVFTRTLPWTSVLRVWDIFFCEGTTISSLLLISVPIIYLPEPAIKPSCKKRLSNLNSVMVALVSGNLTQRKESLKKMKINSLIEDSCDIFFERKSSSFNSLESFSRIKIQFFLQNTSTDYRLQELIVKIYD